MGTIIGVSGPTVTAEGLPDAAVHHRVRVGALGLPGEIIRIDGARVVVQVYEDTLGLRSGEPVEDLGEPLQAELGPGLLGAVFDGVQRPLERMRAEQGDFIGRGTSVRALSREARWEFTPAVGAGDRVGPGDILGTVPETPGIVHRLLVPPGRSGRILEVRPGPAGIEDPVVRLEGGAALTLLQRWPVRVPRPVTRKLAPRVPFLTGQRVFDLLFPTALGGAAVVPGGFGTGKTVVQHSLARHAQADVIVYVGCGERGNEMTEVLEDFPRLVDPASGRPLLERTVLVVNTSNMPVAAREASLYTGITIAEYYRDMGYHVALMADSLSRWAEALREISSRLEEMPGEEGYPTYLDSRLSRYYERAGLVDCQGAGGRTGSVTVVAAISPPGGDFSEPVTQASIRVAGTFWALDADLAHRRHFPAVNPKHSYSLFTDLLAPWFREHAAPDWPVLRAWLLGLLQEEEELQEIVQLLGADSLQERQRVVLETGALAREAFLRQSAYSREDASCPPEKQYWLLKALERSRRFAEAQVDRGGTAAQIFAHPRFAELAALKERPAAGFVEVARGWIDRLDAGEAGGGTHESKR